MFCSTIWFFNSLYFLILSIFSIFLLRYWPKSFFYQSSIFLNFCLTIPQKVWRFFINWCTNFLFIIFARIWKFFIYNLFIIYLHIYWSLHPGGEVIIILWLFDLVTLLNYLSWLFDTAYNLIQTISQSYDFSSSQITTTFKLTTYT